MPNLPTRLRDAAEAFSNRSPDLYGSRPPARVQRAVREGVAVEQGRGLVQAARVQANTGNLGHDPLGLGGAQSWSGEVPVG